MKVIQIKIYERFDLQDIQKRVRRTLFCFDQKSAGSSKWKWLSVWQ